jgi:hypothetical protein
MPDNNSFDRMILKRGWKMLGRIAVMSSLRGSCLPTGWCIACLAVLHLSMCGCGSGERQMQQSSTQLGNAGLQLRIRLQSDHGANKVELVEELKNTSDHPICYALRSWNRQIFQIASAHTVDGSRELVYLAEPKDLSLDGVDPDSSLQIVEGFPQGGGAAEGGEVMHPSETSIRPSESFTISYAGLYRIESEWSLDILDIREAPNYKVLGKCTLKSNTLNLNVASDVREEE